MVGLAGHFLKTGLRRHLATSGQVSLPEQFPESAPPDIWQVSQRLSEEQILAAIAAYLDGSSAKSVSAELGVSKSALLDLLREHRVPVRPRTRLDESDVAEAAELYESGLLLREVAARFSVSTEAVRKRLVAAGVQMRPGIGGRAGGPRRR